MIYVCYNCNSIMNKQTIFHAEEQNAPLLYPQMTEKSDEQLQALSHPQKPTNQTPASPTQEQQKLPPEILHKITIDDTLEGLSLQYGVSPGKIKQHNNLHSDDIFYLKQIMIPNPRSMLEGNKTDPEELLRLKREFAISVFMNQLNKEDRSYSIAKYYLEQVDWDVYKAAQDYKDDLQWENSQKGHPHVPSPIIEEFRKQLVKTLDLKKQADKGLRLIPEYTEIELKDKKIG